MTTPAQPRLLVPMHLDAMVLNQMASVATPFLRPAMNYRNLQSFESPEPTPFEGGSTKPPAAGVYLHWTIPAALRHGELKSDGTTELPLVPNRWLVVRIQHGVAADKAVKAWLLESDWINPKLGDNGTPFVHPTQTSADGTPKPVTIGRATPLGDAKLLTAPPTSPFLRAIGPGSMTFSAFAPGAENVFAFTDDMKDVAAGTFTYHVEGWYSSSDPLLTTTWIADLTRSEDPPKTGTADLTGTADSIWVNREFGWTVHSDTSPSGAGTLLHAMVSGVAWDRNAHNHDPQNYPSNLPQTVKVAVANTAVDALAALAQLESGDHDDGTLMSAFHYDLLDTLNDPGADEALDMQSREHWFGASRNGTLWTVVPPEREGADDNLPAPEPAAMTPAQQKALDTLNAAQRELDRQRRIQQSMQTSLYDLWWKTQWQGRNDVPVPHDPVDFSDWLGTQLPLHLDPPDNSTAWLINAVRAQNSAVTTAEGAANDAGSTLVALLDSKTQVLKPVELPQYRVPNDPVILATGLGRSTALDSPESLTARTLSQAVNALTVAGKTYSFGPGGTDVTKLVPVLADPNHVLPPEIAGVHTESFFLGATLFASAVPNVSVDAVRDGISALPKPTAAKRFAPWSGAMPEWVQPWVPLLLDWEVTVLRGPAYDAPAPDPQDPQSVRPPVCTFNRQYWTFNGTDFEWDTEKKPIVAHDEDFNESNSGQMKLKGRTFITPQLSNTLADQLDEWVHKHAVRHETIRAQLDTLGERVAALRSQDVLSQRLSGLMSMLVQRDQRSMAAPTGAVLDAAGGGHHGHPLPFPDAVRDIAPAVWSFAPMAGTFFVINRLTVIDTQGRSVNLMLANYSTDPQTQSSVAEYYFYPVAGKGLASPTLVTPHPGVRESTDATQRMLQLGPRFVQDARLDFSLTANDKSNADIALASAASPLCGWIVPNQLDRALALYAPDGTAWGSVYLAHSATGVKAEWYPDPTVDDPPEKVEDIPNEYVSAILSALMARDDEGAGFMDFFRAIDESLWTIAPKSAQDADLDVLVGRPLAIVRSSLALRLKGLPPIAQDWWNTFNVRMDDPPDSSEPAPLAAFDGGVHDFTWPVRLGSQVLREDGLVAYFLDDPANPANTWTQCQSLVMPDGAKSGYLREIGGGNFVSLRPTDDTVIAPDAAKNEIARVTMLVDPAAAVHAFTGLLPATTLSVPARFLTPGLSRIAYLFRAGPFLTSPDQVRVPRPAETNGTWEWFDELIERTTTIGAADGQVRFSTVPPLVKEGWLKFTPRKD